jgi:hypothetical protein
LNGPRPEGLARQRVACTSWVCLSGVACQSQVGDILSVGGHASYIRARVVKWARNLTRSFAIASRWRSVPTRACSSLFSCRYYNGVRSDDQRVRVARRPTQLLRTMCWDLEKVLGFPGAAEAHSDTFSFSRTCRVQPPCTCSYVGTAMHESMGSKVVVVMPDQGRRGSTKTRRRRLRCFRQLTSVRSG